MSAKTAAEPRQSDAWVPVEPGDILDGVVESVESGWSDFRNGSYPILRVRDASDDVRAFHAFRTAAFNQVLDKRPTTGERVTITFLGARAKKDGEKNNPPVGYRLVVHGRGAAFDQDLYHRMDQRAAAPATRAVQADDVSEELPF